MKETLLTSIDLMHKIREERRLGNKYKKMFSALLRENVSGKEREEDEARLVQFPTENLAEAKDIVDRVESVDFDAIGKIKKHFQVLGEVIKNSSKVIRSEELMARLEAAEAKFESEFEAYLKSMEGKLMASIKGNNIYFEHFTFERSNARKMYRASRRLGRKESGLISKGREIQAIESSFELRMRGQQVKISEENFEEDLESYIGKFEEYLKYFYDAEIRRFYLDIEELRKVLKVLTLLHLLENKILAEREKNPEFEAKFLELKKAYEQIAEKIKKWKLVDYQRIKGLEGMEKSLDADFKASIEELRKRKAYFKKLQQAYFFDSFKTKLHCTETAYLTAHSMLYHDSINPVKAMAIMGKHVALGTPSMGGRDVQDWTAVAMDLGMKSRKIGLRKIKSLPVGSVFLAMVNILYTLKDTELRGNLLGIFRKHNELDSLNHRVAFLKKTEAEYLYVQNITEFPVSGLLGYVSDPEKIEPIQEEIAALGVGKMVQLNNNISVDFAFFEIMSIADEVLLMERIR